VKDAAELKRILAGLEGRGYKAYKRILGTWRLGPFTLVVDHVQADPFASPSKLRLQIPAFVHGIPPEIWATPARKRGFLDFVLRAFRDAAKKIPPTGGTGHSGRVLVDAGNAEILVRSGAEITEEYLELRFRAGLPARGRSILGRAAARLLAEELPKAAQAVLWENLDQSMAWEFAKLSEDHAHLQSLLAERGLVAFVADGSVLPRASGISSKPLKGAVPFKSPPELSVTLPTRHHGEITGMGVPEGVILITGGGFHGKTTLLEALELGVYPHVPGDGREWVASRIETLKVRSEDGRSVAGVDLRPFIHDLPGGKSTAFFETQDASGSTSLAAAILEGLEAGARVLLLDEDTSATNLLIRDARMQRLVKKETITPLIDRVRELYEKLGVSTILVVGGSGDYLDVADRVILMEEYLPKDATEEARRVAAELPTQRTLGDPAHPLAVTPRCPLPESFDPRRGRKEKVRAKGLREIVFGFEVIELDALEQLVDDSQARAVGAMLKRLGKLADGKTPLKALAERVVKEVEEQGLFALEPSPELALPRLFELVGAANRLRSLQVRPCEEAEG